MENQSEKKWYQKPVTVVLFLIFFFPVGLYLMWKHELWSKTARWIISAVFALAVVANAGKNESTTVSNSNDKANGCTGNGSQSCISEIRQRFQSTGKDIVGEQYEGDGIFQVQFIEYGKGTYNAYIRTDCDCEIAHINITPL